MSSRRPEMQLHFISRTNSLRAELYQKLVALELVVFFFGGATNSSLSTVFILTTSAAFSARGPLRCSASARSAQPVRWQQSTLNGFVATEAQASASVARERVVSACLSVGERFARFLVAELATFVVVLLEHCWRALGVASLLMFARARASCLCLERHKHRRAERRRKFT